MINIDKTKRLTLIFGDEPETATILLANLAQDFWLLDRPEKTIPLRDLIKIVRFFAGLHNRNIVVSTQSFTVAQEFGNLVMLGSHTAKANHEKRAALMEKFGYTEAQTINPADVCVYVLRKDDNGNITVENPSVSDTGVPTAYFADLVNAQNKATDSIFFELIEPIDE
jgi:hypothetical protein